MARRNKKRPSATVSSIQTDYVRTLQQKVDRRHAQRVRLRRRLAVFIVAAVIILGGLTHTFINQKKLLAAKEKEKEALLVQFKEVEAEQEMLERQITKLSDDEYIAKLARQEYFLSDKNEIIFSIPKKVDTDDKKKVEKE